MDYREILASEPLNGLVKAHWTLSAEGAGDAPIDHQATPDGCIELILRQTGRSRWRANQPSRFAVGLTLSPIGFEISSDATFAAVRLWPWTWRAVSSIHPNAFCGSWIEPRGEIIDRVYASLGDVAAVEAVLIASLGEQRAELARIGKAILGASSVGEMSERTGMGPRRLQRWFADKVGLAPRRYLRLLRFQNAFGDLTNAELLADHAAQYGFADQAHMAREFRQMAGKAASRARNKTSGPFLA